jgi:propionate CoA-transferase
MTHANLNIPVAPAASCRASKLVDVDEAVALIGDGDTVCNSGFVGCGVPDELLAALERRFLQSGAPRDLTVLFAAGQGDGKDRGLNRLAHEGLVSCVIGGHWGLIPKMAQLALDGKITAYNLPQGCISHLYRDIAAGKPGTITKVGLNTFVDPRINGGRINAASSDDVVRLMEIDGEEYLFYKSRRIDVAFIRGTTADLDGNVTMEREALTLDGLAMATAARNSGGIVIVQVENVAERGSLNPREVRIPGILVDCVVLGKPENHAQTYATAYSRYYSGESKAPGQMMEKLPLDERKIIARRVARELPRGGVVNLGIGMPEGVAKVAAEEGVLDRVTLTAEPGIIGGIPASGLNFGAAVNPQAVIDQNQQFDFYDGGGLDLACLGMAQADAEGNVNVSRFGKRLAGAGGFINISQNARSLAFAGTFTAGGLEIAAEDGRLRIVKEGRDRKFIQRVEQITFSGLFARRKGQPVLFVTERCVFRLVERGLELTEVAEGVDLKTDILDLMDFRPHIDDLKIMHPTIFQPQPMGLQALMDRRDLRDRFVYDRGRQVLFIDFTGLRVAEPETVRAIERIVEERCGKLGRRVEVVVNYADFRVDEAVADEYVAMVRRLLDTYYGKVTRYAPSAFLRAKLGSAGVLNAQSRIEGPEGENETDDLRRSV